MRKILFALSFVVLVSFAKAQNAIPNAGFEQWNVNPNYDDPVGWGTINGLTYILGVRTATKATGADAHSGTYALKLESKNVPVQGTAPGIAATGVINPSTQAVDGGVVYTKRPIALTGWYKYQPNGVDTGSVFITFWKWNNGTRNEVGSAEFVMTTTVNSYTQFSVNINYTSATFPDSMVITLLTSSRAQGSPVGTKLFIDDLAFVLCNNFTATASAGTAATCTAANGTASVTTANGAGGNVYTWSNNANSSSITASAGNYNVTVTDGNGCSATSSTAITANNTTITSTISSTQTTCGAATGTATVVPTNGTANYTYNWNTGGNTDAISSLGAGNYQVTITDANGCSGTASTSVTTPNGPSATQVTTNVSCNGAADGAIAVTTVGGTGNITYAWSPSGSTEDLSGLSGGTYTLTITDGNNCSFTISTVVNEPAVLTAITSHTNVSCNGANDGTITITVAGGTAPYTYFGNSVPAGTTTYQNMAAGTYAGNLTDANQCTAAVFEVVTEPAVLSVTLTATDASTSTATDGAVSSVVTGGTSNYSYTWNNSSTADDLNNVGAGSYCVTVTDNNLCTVTACATVSAPSAIGNVSEAGMLVYPNPANGELVIETGAANGKFNFTVYSISGKLVREEIVTGEKVTVDVKQLPVGFYSYRLTNTVSGNTNYGKLQIQR